MPQGSKILGEPINEEKWSRAKELAEKEGHGGEYDYIMGIYKRMMRLGEYKKSLEPYQSMRVALVKGDLDEFVCGNCGALLLKGKHLEKAHIEVKCRRCGTLVMNV